MTEKIYSGFQIILIVIFIAFYISLFKAILQETFSPKSHYVYNPSNYATLTYPLTFIVLKPDSQKDSQVNIQKTTPPDSENIKSESIYEYGIAAGSSLSSLNQEKLDEYFQTLNSLGVKWVRWDIGWDFVQPENSANFNWNATDRIAETAIRYGIHSLAIITYTPSWASQEGCANDSKCTPSDAKAFGLFSGKVASRYKDKIFYFEIWNEPNSTTFWKPKPDVSSYADILKEAYKEIKKANPESVVLSGGLSGIGNDKEGNIAPSTFIQSLYDLRANPYFDAVSLHPYTYPYSPNAKTSFHWQEMVSVRRLMNTYGESTKNIWITEFGVATGGPGIAFNVNQVKGFNYGSDFMTEKAQADILKEAVLFYQQNIAQMGPFFWYTLKDSGDKSNTTENFYGLFRYDGSKKPAYEIFRNIIVSK